MGSIEVGAITLALPEETDWRLHVGSTVNASERLTQEVRRQERVIRSFPSEASAHGLVGQRGREECELLGRPYLRIDD